MFFYARYFCQGEGRKFMNWKISKLILYVSLALILLGACQRVRRTEIYLPEHAGNIEQLAAKELRRYLFVSTGYKPEIYPIKEPDEISRDGYLIIGPKDTLMNEILPQEILKARKELTNESILVQSIQYKRKKLVLFTGGSQQAVLFAVYRYLEKRGIHPSLQHFPGQEKVPQVAVDSI